MIKAPKGMKKRECVNCRCNSSVSNGSEEEPKKRLHQELVQQ